ncbi:hypothetical protein V6N13_147923 [Hibiscus sabdariffa]
MNLLISTKHLNRIEESIVLEVGKESFSIFASEIHSVRLIHKGTGDDSKKEPVRSESINSSSSSSSTTPSEKLKSQNLNLNGEEILRSTKLLEKDELDLGNCIKDLKEPQNSHLWATEPASPVSRGPSRVELVGKTMVSAHIEQPGDNAVAGHNPIQERIRDDILSTGFVRDEEVRDFEVGDEELYGSEGRGVANISPGQKKSQI